MPKKNSINFCEINISKKFFEDKYIIEFDTESEGCKIICYNNGFASMKLDKKGVEKLNKFLTKILQE